MAVTGKQDYAHSLFEHQESVLNAGVLFAVPALIAQGLKLFFKVFRPLPAGFYGLHHVILILCFMALCRIKNLEQLEKSPPGELGKLLGLDRIPEVGYFRKNLKQITDQMPQEQRYNRLKQESKKLKNAIIMLVYRAESALYNTLSEFYKSTEKEGRVILKEIFTSDADMIPDFENSNLTIQLHSLSTPRANQAVKELCLFLNQTETRFPFTNLRLIYKTVEV